MGGEKVYATRHKNIMGARTLLDGLMADPMFQNSPLLKKVNAYVNAIGIQDPSVNPHATASRRDRSMTPVNLLERSCRNSGRRIYTL